MLQERLAAIARHLREQGYRFTPQRMAIVQAVLESPGHPSAEEIYHQVSAVFPMISLATIYTTLDILKNLSEVQEFSVGGRARYDGNLQPHIHLICERCHTVMDWSEEMAFPIPEEAITASGFHPHYYRLEVHGLCSRCKSAISAPAPKGRAL